jgi:hypothetical protein
MSMRFRYTPLKTAAPVWPLGGRLERPKPIVTATLLGPTIAVWRESLLDTGADDTVFHESVAAAVGVDLTGAPTGQGKGVGGAMVSVRYALVKLRLTDGHEFREWPAWVGFTAVPMHHGLLGFAGCLQYFDANFRGAREEVGLTVNSLYPGT